MLRKELQILSRQLKKPKLTTWDRLFFVSLFKANSHVIFNAVTLKPCTIIPWHRRLVKKKTDYSKENRGRPPVTDEIKRLVLEMEAKNRCPGCRKIKGELRKLGIELGKSAIVKILCSAGYTPLHQKFSRTWLKVLVIPTHLR